MIGVVKSAAASIPNEIPPTVPSAASSDGGSALVGLVLVILIALGIWYLIGKVFGKRTPVDLIKGVLSVRERGGVYYDAVITAEEEGEGEAGDEGGGVSVEEHENLKKRLKDLKKTAKQEKEARKRAEESLAETESYKEELESSVFSKDEELQNKDKTIEDMEKESSKLAKFYARRYGRGEYVPVIRRTINGNPIPFEWCAGIVWNNGGWRAILVHSPTADPEKHGRMYPSPDKSGPQFMFNDDPGFNPNNPKHKVLFDTSSNLWERDLRISRGDPKSYGVGFDFGVDEEGNPRHALAYGMIKDINQKREENLNLKTEANHYWSQLTKEQHKASQLEKDLEVYKDRAKSLESEINFLRMQWYDTQDAFDLQSHEMETVKRTARTNELRGLAHKKMGDEAERRLNEVRTIPVTSDGNGGGGGRTQELYRLLEPIAKVDAGNYGINPEKYVNDPKQLVEEWLSKKYEKDGYTLEDIASRYGLETAIKNAVYRGGDL